MAGGTLVVECKRVVGSSLRGAMFEQLSVSGYQVRKRKREGVEEREDGRGRLRL